MGNDASSYDSGKYKSSFDWETQYLVLHKHSNNILKLQKRDTQGDHLSSNSNLRQQRQVYYGRQMIIANKQEKLQVQRLIQLKALNPCPFVTEIQKSAICKTDNYCSSQEKYYILFRTPDTTLRQDIINRKLSGCSFNPDQLILIIENISKGLKYLRQNRHPHQNISMDSVFIYPKKNDKQVLAVLGDPWISSCSQKIHKNSGIHSYPSYEKLMYRADTIQKYDSFQSDLFSLGCLILELINQQTMNIIYNRGFTAINEYQLERKIGQITNDQIRNAIRTLCSRNPRQRQTIFSHFKEGQKKTYLKTSALTKSKQRTINQNPNYTPINGSIFNTTNNNTPMVKSLSHQQGYGLDNRYANRHQIEKGKPHLGQYTTSNIKFDNYAYSPLNRKYSNNSYQINNMAVKPAQQYTNKISFASQIKDSRSYTVQNPTHAFSNPNFINPVSGTHLPINSRSLQKEGNKHLPISNAYQNYKPKQEISGMNKDHRSYSMSKLSTGTPSHSKISSQIGFSNYNGPLATNSNFGVINYAICMATPSNKTDELSKMNSGKQPFTFNSISSQKSEKQIRNSEQLSQQTKMSKQSKISQTERSKQRKQKQFHNPFEESNKDKSSIEKFKQIQQRINNTIKTLKLTPPQILSQQIVQKPKKQQVQPTSDRSHKQIKVQSKQDSNIKIQDQLQCGQVFQEKLKTPKNPPKRTNFGSTIKQATNQSASQDQDCQILSQQHKGSLQFVIQEYDVGSRYEGYKKNGMRNGKGKFFYKEGSHYNGEWKDNKMHGKGLLYYANGKVAYDGEWHNDEFNGYGKVFNDQIKFLQTHFDYTDFYKLDDFWEFYEGQLKSDARDGKGKVKLSNGQIFIGNFSKDKVSGQGTYYTKEGNIIKGRWKNNRLISKE